MAFMLESMLIHSFALFWTNGGFYVGNLSSFTLKGKSQWNNIPEIGDFCLIGVQIQPIPNRKIAFNESDFPIRNGFYLCVTLQAGVKLLPTWFEAVVKL